MNFRKLRMMAAIGALALTTVACTSANEGNAPANGNGGEEATNNTAATTEAAGSLEELKDIVVVSREDGSGTRDAFTEIVGLVEKDASGNEMDTTTEEATVQNSTNGVMTTVAGNESSIGYISLGSLNDTVKALKVDGVEANPEDIINGSYKVSRPFLLVSKELPAGSIEEDFLKFAASPQGQAIVEEEGYVKAAEGEEYTASGLSGNITVAGSTSVTPVMEKLAEAYKGLNPDATIEIQSNGSSAGITAAMEGTAQIGMSSRELKEEEKGSLQEFVLAKDGIAVIVNNANPLEDIGMEQIKSVFNGEMLEWAELAN